MANTEKDLEKIYERFIVKEESGYYGQNDEAIPLSLRSEPELTFSGSDLGGQYPAILDWI